MKLHRNIYLWYATTFLSYAAFIMPIWVIFNTEILGLNNTQALILGMLAFSLSAIFEIPTGAWADRYGRARTYQLGTVFYIISVASFIVLTNFWALLILQVLGALGLAMQSGGLEALVHDSLPNDNKTARYARIHANKMTILFISRVLTVLLSGLLYAVNPKAPFVVAALTFSLGFVVSLFYKEVRIEAPSSLSNFKHVKETVSLLLTKQTLAVFLGLITLFALCSEALFVFYQPYFASLHIPVGEFGFFYAVISLLAAVGAFWAGSIIKRYNARWILLGMLLSMLCTMGLMTFQSRALAFAVIIPSSLAFGFTTTLVNTSVQKLMSSRYQATALSIASFLQNVAMLVAVIAVGVSLDLASVHAVNIGLVLITLTCCMICVLGAKNNPLKTKPPGPAPHLDSSPLSL